MCNIFLLILYKALCGCSVIMFKNHPKINVFLEIIYILFLIERARFEDYILYPMRDAQFQSTQFW